VPDESSPSTGSRSPYLHIADVLRGEILDGRYPVGERIPSQAELEERFDVSRPTVQRALTELRKDGYIDNQRGRAAEVLPRREQHGRAVASEDPDLAFAVLDAHIAIAFEQRHVAIDSFSLTTETLNAALAMPLLRIKLGELRPESIALRVLLPSPDAMLAIPKLVADPTDPRPLNRLRNLVSSHVTTLRSAFNGLSVIAPGIEHSIEVRAVPVTPLAKLYLLNQDTALYAYYRVVPRTVPLGAGEEGEILDVLGISATLFPYRADPADPGSSDSRFVEESQQWFESLWTTIAEPMTPQE
jgi:DNA-binding transcriptional regulator YhcF (GntR family)